MSADSAIETAVEPRFQEHFIRAIAIPHEDLEFPNLARSVELPAGSRKDTKPLAGAASLSRRQRRKLRLAVRPSNAASGPTTA